MLLLEPAAPPSSEEKSRAIFDETENARDARDARDRGRVRADSPCDDVSFLKGLMELVAIMGGALRSTQHDCRSAR